MGASFSVTSNEQYSKVVNDAILNTLVEFSDSCGATSNTKQSISLKRGKFGAIINSLNQRANASINLQCLQNSVTQQDLEDRLQSAVKQAVESQSTPAPTLLSGLGFNTSFNVSKAVSEQINRVARTVSVDNIKTCLTQLNVDQELTFGDEGPIDIDALINSGNQTVSTDVIAKCVQSNTLTQKAVLDLSNELNQEAKFRFGLDAWGITGIVLTIVFVCCCCSILSSILSAMNTTNNGQPQAGPRGSTPTTANAPQNGLAGVANQVLANVLTNAMFKPGPAAGAALGGPAMGAALGGGAGLAGNAGRAATLAKMI